MVTSSFTLGSRGGRVESNKSWASNVPWKAWVHIITRGPWWSQKWHSATIAFMAHSHCSLQRNAPRNDRERRSAPSCIACSFGHMTIPRDFGVMEHSGGNFPNSICNRHCAIIVLENGCVQERCIWGDTCCTGASTCNMIWCSCTWWVRGNWVF